MQSNVECDRSHSALSVWVLGHVTWLTYLPLSSGPRLCSRPAARLLWDLRPVVDRGGQPAASSHRPERERVSAASAPDVERRLKLTAAGLPQPHPSLQVLPPYSLSHVQQFCYLRNRNDSGSHWNRGERWINHLLGPSIIERKLAE